MLQIEFDFTLPRGYLDDSGTLHREGVMRLATARDELDALHDSFAVENPDYLPVLVLSQVVTELGTLASVTPDVILDLFAQDYQFLQSLYIRLNASPEERGAAEIIETTCPQCGAALEIEAGSTGEI